MLLGVLTEVGRGADAGAGHDAIAAGGAPDVGGVGVLDEEHFGGVGGPVEGRFDGDGAVHEVHGIARGGFVVVPVVVFGHGLEGCPDQRVGGPGDVEVGFEVHDLGLLLACP